MEKLPDNYMDILGTINLSYLKDNAGFYLLDYFKKKAIAILWCSDNDFWYYGITMSREFSSHSGYYINYEYTGIDVKHALSIDMICKYELTTNFEEAFELANQHTN